MPYIETPVELADYLADKIGIYGGHDDECTPQKPCRCCWVSEMAERIRRTVKNEASLETMFDHPKEGPNW
jgi:hypothetical protein